MIRKFPPGVRRLHAALAQSPIAAAIAQSPTVATSPEQPSVATSPEPPAGTAGSPSSALAEPVKPRRKSRKSTNH